jgi:hypothetical protein
VRGFCLTSLCSLYAIDVFASFLIRLYCVAEILWGENFRVSKGPEENKKTATASCKLCTRSCTSKFSKVWGERECSRAAATHSKSNFLQKISVSERFGLGRPLYCLLLLTGFFAGFLSLQGLTVWPRKIGQIVRRSEILTEILNFYFCHPLAAIAAINPKKLPKLAKSALKEVKKNTEKYATPNTKA